MPFTGFSEDQIRQFQSQGWVAIPDFWSEAEISAIRAELDRLKNEGLLRNVATDGDGKTHSQTKANLQICPMAPHSRFFRAMPFAPQIKVALSQLLGDNATLHLDQAFLKPGKHGAGTNWHQDNAYFKIPDPLKGTAIWTAVHDATIANGTMRVIPGVFDQNLEHQRDPDSDHHIRCWPDESQAVTVELPAGGALFFCYGTPHATGANLTNKERAGVALHFLNADSVPDDYFGGQVNGIGHPVLTGSNADDGTISYGEPFAKLWPHI
jgi:ectoine hydroxylase-related dioxygenase (phytanoyl-CoA dioxygenase family)